MGFSAGGEVAFLAAQRFTLAPSDGERAGERGTQLSTVKVTGLTPSVNSPSLPDEGGRRGPGRGGNSEDSKAPLSGSLPARSSQGERDDPIDGLSGEKDMVAFQKKWEKFTLELRKSEDW
jgi:hypothetical protein